MKVCGVCKIEKELNQFSLRKASKDGYAHNCKNCASNYYKKYRVKNSEKLKHNVDVWVSNNQEKHKESRKKYLEKTKDTRKKQTKKYYDSNHEKITTQQKLNYVLKKEEHKERNRKYYSEKYNVDIMFTLKTKIRRRITNYFSKSKLDKLKRTNDILGCDWEILKNHIESQFTEGMTWDNHGQYGWHIDHHIPLATAKTEQDVYRLNHYTNLKPLWWHENLKKGDKISEEWGNA
jgi:hypothetical protein